VRTLTYKNTAMSAIATKIVTA